MDHGWLDAEIRHGLGALDVRQTRRFMRANSRWFDNAYGAPSKRPDTDPSGVLHAKEMILLRLSQIVNKPRRGTGALDMLLAILTAWMLCEVFDGDE